MAQKQPFFVAIPEHHEHGFPVTVTPNPDVRGMYRAVAEVTVRDERNRPFRVKVEATIIRNEAGFRGRDWDLVPDEFPAPTQHSSLRAAAQDLGTEALRQATFRRDVADIIKQEQA